MRCFIAAFVGMRKKEWEKPLSLRFAVWKEYGGEYETRSDG